MYRLFNRSLQVYIAQRNAKPRSISRSWTAILNVAAHHSVICNMQVTWGEIVWHSRTRSRKCIISDLSHSNEKHQHWCRIQLQVSLGEIDTWEAVTQTCPPNAKLGQSTDLMIWMSSNSISRSWSESICQLLAQNSCLTHHLLCRNCVQHQSYRSLDHLCREEMHLQVLRAALSQSCLDSRLVRQEWSTYVRDTDSGRSNQSPFANSKFE